MCGTFKLDVIAQAFSGYDCDISSRSNSGFVHVRVPVDALNGPPSCLHPSAPRGGHVGQGVQLFSSLMRRTSYDGVDEQESFAGESPLDGRRVVKLDTERSLRLTQTFSPAEQQLSLFPPLIDPDEGRPLVELFFFSYGVLVWWSPLLPEQDWEHCGAPLLQYLDDHKTAFEEGSQEAIEPETCFWSIEPAQSELWAGSTPPASRASFTAIDCDMFSLQEYDTDVMAAYSFGLAQSAKLSVLEEEVQLVVRDAQERQYPELILEDSVLPPGTALAKKRGEVFQHRMNLNLYTDILDTPAWFWRRSDLESACYSDARWYMEIQNRADVLDKRLKVMHELFDVVGEERKTREASRLEWYIIWLLLFDVIVTGVTVGIHLLRRSGVDE